MSARLLANQFHFFHQTTYHKAPHHHAFIIKFCLKRSAASRVSTTSEQLTQSDFQRHTLRINFWFTATIFVVARAADPKHTTKHIDWLLLSQLINYRVRFHSSDIKRAEAFFNMSFSISSLRQRASSS